MTSYPPKMVDFWSNLTKNPLKPIYQKQTKQPLNLIAFASEASDSWPLGAFFAEGEKPVFREAKNVVKFLSTKTFTVCIPALSKRKSLILATIRERSERQLTIRSIFSPKAKNLFFAKQKTPPKIFGYKNFWALFHNFFSRKGLIPLKTKPRRRHSGAVTGFKILFDFFVRRAKKWREKFGGTIFRALGSSVGEDRSIYKILYRNPNFRTEWENSACISV